MNTIFLLGIAGSIISILLVILGFIFKAFYAEHKNMILELGRLNGIVEVNKTKSEEGLHNLNQKVELQISELTRNISLLTDRVSELLDVFLKSKTGNGKH